MGVFLAQDVAQLKKSDVASSHGYIRPLKDLFLFHALISHARLPNYTMPNTPTLLTKVGIYKYIAGLV